MKSKAACYLMALWNCIQVPIVPQLIVLTHIKEALNNRVVYRKARVSGPGPIHCNAKSQTIKKEREIERDERPIVDPINCGGKFHYR